MRLCKNGVFAGNMFAVDWLLQVKEKANDHFRTIEANHATNKYMSDQTK